MLKIFKRINGENVFVEAMFNVVKIHKYVASRNHSDTADYSDYQSTDCVEALVWVGSEWAPPKNNKFSHRIWSFEQSNVRTLEPHEQFGYIDCTKIHVYPGSEILVPEVDDPLDTRAADALPHYMAYQAKLAAEAAAKKAVEDALRMATEEAAAQKAAKKAAVDKAGEMLAYEELRKIPMKGTEVTVGNFKGVLFWSGVRKYRGEWNASFGLRDVHKNTMFFKSTDLKTEDKT